MAEKRRILHKLRITEISAVDNPCQEHARMVIMKRAPIERVVTKAQRRLRIAGRLAILKSNIQELNKDASNIEGQIHVPTFIVGPRRRKKKLRDRVNLLKEQVIKFNPHHGQGGRFASSSGGGGSSNSTGIAKPSEPESLVSTHGKILIAATIAIAAGAAALWIANPIIAATISKFVLEASAGALLGREINKVMEHPVDTKLPENMSTSAEKLTKVMAEAHKVNGEQARKKVIDAVDQLIKLREAQLSDGSATQIFFNGTKSPRVSPIAAKAASTKSDFVIDRLKMLLNTLKTSKV